MSGVWASFNEETIQDRYKPDLSFTLEKGLTESRLTGLVVISPHGHHPPQEGSRDIVVLVGDSVGKDERVDDAKASVSDG